MTARSLLRWGLMASIAIAIVFALIHRERIDTATLDAWVAASGHGGPLLFIAIYAIATILFVPGTLLTLAGGALFGPFAGTLYNVIGATIGAVASFSIARFIGGEWVESRSRGLVKCLQDGIADEGWRFVAFTRLVPLFPFNLLNYALGLTRISFWQNFVTSAICMAPGAAAYTYLGHAGRQAIDGDQGLIDTALITLALFAVILFIPRVIKRFRQQGST